MFDKLKDWRLMAVFIFFDRILTIYLVSQLGLAVEVNPIIAMFYPYSLIIVAIPVLLLAYHLRYLKKAIAMANVIWLIIVLINFVQVADFLIGLQLITYTQAIALL
jgi:hypothetical protein